MAAAGLVDEQQLAGLAAPWLDVDADLLERVAARRPCALGGDGGGTVVDVELDAHLLGIGLAGEAHRETEAVDDERGRHQPADRFVAAVHAGGKSLAGRADDEVLTGE